MRNYNVKQFRNKMKSKLLSRNTASTLPYGSQACINSYTLACSIESAHHPLPALPINILPTFLRLTKKKKW